MSCTPLSRVIINLQFLLRNCLEPYYSNGKITKLYIPELRTWPLRPQFLGK